MTLNRKKNRQLIIYIITMIALVIIDQYTKILALSYLKDKEPFIIVNNVFELRYLENRGAAFGMMQNQKLLFIIIAAVMLFAVMYFLIKVPIEAKYKLLNLCMILIGAGAVGNLIDRVSRNYVVDFFYFSLIDFPIFNVADIYVSVSCAVLIILILFIYKDNDFDFLKKNKAVNGKV